MSDQSRFTVYLRNFVFGVEDSLVSTVGLLSGVASAGVDKNTLFLTGVVLIFVEAFSMAVGSFLSERSAQQYLRAGAQAPRYSLWAGIIMFFSYFVSGFIPLAPYLFMDVSRGLPTSIVLSVIALFILGLVSGRIVKEALFKNGLRMAIIGGGAIALGIIVGKYVGVS